MTRTLRAPARPVFLPSTAGALLLMMTLTGGCAFDRDWKRLAAAPQSAATTTAADTDPLAGRWEGTWRSQRSNHAGKLRAIIRVADGDDAAYRADFDATYMGLLRFGYSMNLAAQRDGAVTRFQGEENLGWIAGGLYQYAGTTDGQSFECAYQSKSDHGTFQMTRPGP